MRKLFFILVGCVVILLAVYVGFRSYRVSKNNHLLNLARDFVVKKDGRNAMLCVQQVLNSDPRNIEASRLMAGFAEAAHSPAALFWRKRVVDLNPHSMEDHLALAQTAIALHDFAAAGKALDEIDHLDKNTARYHITAGNLAISTGDAVQAENQFAEALKIEPQNMLAQLNLAVVQLHGTNAPENEQARSQLRTISQNSTNSFLRCQALRELIVDSSQQQNTNDAIAFSGLLLAESGSSFPDHLLQLDVLQIAHNPGFDDALSAAERLASSDVGKAYEMASWQLVKLSPQNAMDWINTLSPTVVTNQSLELLSAQCHDALKDWAGLQSQLKDQNWGELEFARHTFLCRALRGQNLVDSSKAEWEVAVKLANSQKESLAMLLRLVSQWGWQSEEEEILWATVQNYPGESWAFQSLSRMFTSAGRTQSLLQLYKELLKNHPNDAGVKNNVAFCALLLGVPELKPDDMAREIYQQSPTNANFIATYAFSLYLQGKHPDDLKLMEQIPAQQLQDVSLAGYYAITLQAAGQTDKAKQYFALAEKAQLLPEEKKLFDHARSGN